MQTCTICNICSVCLHAGCTSSMIRRANKAPCQQTQTCRRLTWPRPSEPASTLSCSLMPFLNFGSFK